MAQKPTYEELEQRVREFEKLEADYKRTERDLQDFKQKWMSLLENTNDFIMVIDGNGRIRYINKSIPPNTVDQVIGKALFDYAAPEHHETIRRTVDNVFETRKQGSYRSSVEHPTGTQWFETTIIPIIKEGKVSSAMLFNKNITKRKQAVEALRKAHDELEIRVKKRTADLISSNEKLENEVYERKKSEEALRESVENFKALAENANDGILIASKDGKHVYANTRASAILGYNKDELIGTNIEDLAHPDEYKKIKERYNKILKRKAFQSHYETMVIRKDKKEVPVEVSSALTTWHGISADLVFFRDISDRKKMEASLKTAKEELEKRVEKRTKELEIKTKSLEDLNTAMKVLLEKRKEDNIKLEDKVMANVRELITPMFDKIRKTKLDDHQKVMLNIMASNLNEITSPFVQKLSMKNLHLTPTELKIANYIKYGTTTKEIAKLMKSSPRTIETHRKNIRKKIGLDKKGRNLRSFLLSIH